MVTLRRAYDAMERSTDCAERRRPGRRTEKKLPDCAANLPQQRAELLCLRARQPAENVALGGFHRARPFSDGLAPGRRQGGQTAATIVGVGFARYQTVRFEAIDQLRDVGLDAREPLREL